ncbi:MAG: fused MFS/spermidine synthase [Bryobacteraceae bacterium]|jgi:SAM-dependent methyltransferase
MLLYALTILASAFLLFQVEPIIAKIILPWFGGSAAVWTVSLLFFQLALLAGYLYAHASVRYLKPRAQMVVHVGLLAVSLLALPIYPREAWKPGPGEDPTFGILRLLTVTVGLTFFLLSTTAPLVQAWYARRFQGAVPYRLYALSNAGSMLALLSYPVLVEPLLTTRQQTSMWSWAYAGFLAVCVAAALRSGAGAGEPLSAATDAAAVVRPGPRLYAQWLALPACASVLLLAITNHLSQNVAAIPFLWVLPLSLYLLSFILCFESSGWYRRNPYLQLLAVALGSMAYAIGADLGGNLNIKVLVTLFSLGLFTCCMVCHGELAELKPHPRYLTHYYLMISAGGALGGIIVGLVAPKLLDGYYELPLGLVFNAVLIVTVLKLDSSLTWFRKWWQPAPLAAVVLTLALAVFVGLQIRNSLADVRLRVRNFYGELTVKDSGPPTDLDATRSLTHGTINHGEQFLNPAKRDLPTTYYGKNTGIGVAIRSKGKTAAVRVGVIGLGTGTIAAYARPGDYYRYYEINPLVLWIAHTQFTFLANCKGKVEVAMGDARLSLERESPENFDVVAVDAFSGDAIPIHLLTRQAMDLYFHHLRPNGILAVHISNRYLDLQPVLAGETNATGRVARVVDTEDDDSADVFGATWVLVTTPAAGFDGDILKSSTEIQPARKVRLWTDDYSNLFRILK